MIPRVRSGALALVFAFAVALTAAASSAAPFAQEGSPPGGPDGDPRMSDQEASDLHETLEIYMLAKMKTALGLSQEQNGKVVPLVQELSESRRRFNKERRLTMMRLYSLAEDSTASDDEIRRTLDRMDDGERAFRESEASTLRSIRSVLTPRQQAQFVVFREKFRREMMERLRALRDERPPGGGRPGGRPGAGPQRRGPIR